MSDNITPIDTDVCQVTFDKKEYSIVGDAFYPTINAEMPQWLLDLINQYITNTNQSTYNNLSQYSTALLAALESVNISKNTYEQYISKVITDQSAYVASLITLNASIANSDASIRQLLSTYATQDYANSTAAQLLTASINGGAIGAKIGSVETAMATQYGAIAQRLDTLTSVFTDNSAQQNANATAIQDLKTYTGYGIIDGLPAVIANSHFYRTLDAYLTGSGYDIGGGSTLVQEVQASSTSAAKTVEAKFAYNSHIEINGKTYNAGFGLNALGTLLPDGVTYDSEFWVKASRFKFISDDGVTTSTPFQISGNTVYIGWDAITGSTKPEDGATRNVNRGVWATGVTYKKGDIVTKDGSSYTAKADHVSSVDITTSNTLYWELLASAGVSGESTAVVLLYYVTSSASAPTAQPSGTFTYSFTTLALTGGTLNGWLTTYPTLSVGQYLWTKQAFVKGSGTVSVAASSFSPASLYTHVAEDGTDGVNGERGTAIATSTWGPSDSAFQSSTGFVPKNGDQLVVVDSYSGSTIYTRISGVWQNTTALKVHGNAVIDGTLSVAKLVSGYVGNGSYYVALGGSGQASQAGAVVGIGPSSSVGVVGQSQSGSGVHGTSLGSGAGVYGYSPSGTGVHGIGSTGLTGIGTDTGGVFSGGVVSVRLGDASNAKAVYATAGDIKTTGVFQTSSNTYSFTGAHEALLAADEVIEIGDILTDTNNVIQIGISNAIGKVTKSSSTTSAAVCGIYCGELAGVPMALSNLVDGVDVLDDKYFTFMEGYKLIGMNAIGDGLVNVCGENGNLSVGDLIVASSTPGKGMRQSDDVVRNYTVAKCRENVVFDYPEQVKQVACFYMCG